MKVIKLTIELTIEETKAITNFLDAVDFNEYTGRGVSEREVNAVKNMSEYLKYYNV